VEGGIPAARQQADGIDHVLEIMKGFAMQKFYSAGLEAAALRQARCLPLHWSARPRMRIFAVGCSLPF
jgi:hypothetical protein